MEQTGGFEGRTKKEILMLTRETNKLERSLGGIRDMQKVPSAIWVVDTNKEHLAVSEAIKLGVPELSAKIGEKLELRRAAYFDGNVEAYLHKRAADLPPAVGVLVEYQAGDAAKGVEALGGIRDMAKVPSAIWVVDTNKEHIAVGEARKLGIPVIAILDTNCDPDEVDSPIPGNDDASRSAALLTKVIASAVAEGLQARAGQGRGDGKPEAETAEPLPEWEQEPPCSPR